MEKEKKREKRLTRIPYLKANNGIGISVHDALCEEAGSDSRGDLSRVECAFAIAHNEGGFPDVLSAKNDNFSLERRHVEYFIWQWFLCGAGVLWGRSAESRGRSMYDLATGRSWQLYRFGKEDCCFYSGERYFGQAGMIKWSSQQ